MENDEKNLASLKLLSKLAKVEEAGNKEGFVSFAEVRKILEQSS